MKSGRGMKKRNAGLPAACKVHHPRFTTHPVPLPPLPACRLQFVEDLPVGMGIKGGIARKLLKVRMQWGRGGHCPSFATDAV
jgi:hypothetical protein